MDGALREDVNGENWLFVRDLEMWFQYVVQGNKAPILKCHSSTNFQKDHSKVAEKKWAHFVGK